MMSELLVNNTRSVQGREILFVVDYPIHRGFCIADTTLKYVVGITLVPHSY